MTIDVDKQRTLRDMIRRVSPPWLQGKNGYKLLYSFATIMDAVLDSGYAAVKLKLPGLYDYSTLSLIGQERKLGRGLVETDEGYALRLRRWWAAARGRGNPYELANQLVQYISDGAVEIIYRSGRRFSLAGIGGDVLMDDIEDWNPDSTPELWATYTVLLLTDVFHILPPAELATALNDLRSMIIDLNAAHCHGSIQVMASDTEFFDALPPPPGQPDLSTWDDPGPFDSEGQEAFVINF